ncbi:complexin-like isoform X1 [Tubulanus polymorphus]|uniref:complexin-like isoform X1 n=1 Tax=Tubulanus polymorphus TaxID=672921 RepID=UPI003DA4B4D0
MASFIAKQMVGNQLKSVKEVLHPAAGAGGNEEGDGENKEAEEDPEVAEARREAEERRKEKHRKMEEERETMRQEIRDKYGIKKREEPKPEEDDPGRIGRKKKSPAELAAEAAAAEEAEDDFASFLPGNVREMASKVTEMPSKLASEVTEKCSLQ